MLLSSGCGYKIMGRLLLFRVGISIWLTRNYPIMIFPKADLAIKTFSIKFMIPFDNLSVVPFFIIKLSRIHVVW